MGITGFEGKQDQNKISKVNECQEFCKQNPSCKIFYWNSKSRNCFTAGHLYKGENQIILEANSIIGLSNCLNNSRAVLESIFTTRPTENSTAYIIGAVVVLLLIGGFASFSFVKQKQKDPVGKQVSLSEQQSYKARINEVKKEINPGKFFFLVFGFFRVSCLNPGKL